MEDRLVTCSRRPFDVLLRQLNYLHNFLCILFIHLIFVLGILETMEEHNGCNTLKHLLVSSFSSASI